MSKLEIPSNLSKSFCIDVLKNCGLLADSGFEIQSKLENYIMVETQFVEQAEEILNQCSIIRARKLK